MAIPVRGRKCKKPRLNGQGDQYQRVIEWAERQRPAASIAADIKSMLPASEPVEAWQPTEADKRRAWDKAVKNQPRRGSIGSMPAAWRQR